MTDVSQEWQVICDGLRGRGRHLLETGLWTDCELTVGAGETKTSFRLHRTILAMASLVFVAEFFEGQEHASLADVDPDVFRQLLRYIYTDECRVDSVEAACKLASLAYRLTVLPPIKACVVLLKSRINVENVLQILETAEIIKNSELSNKALKFICQHTKQVLAHPSLLTVNVETLSMVFRQIVLGIDSEMELVSAAHKYAKAHPTCSMRNAVRYIRFLTLSIQEFSEALAGPSLLTSDESVLIFRKIGSPAADIAMPQGFSTITTSRIKIARNEADDIEPEEAIECVDHRYLERIGYERMIEELKTRETENKSEYQKNISNFETERSAMKANIDLLKDDNIRLKTALTKLEKENNSMKSSIDLLKADKLTKDKAALETNIAKLKSDIDSTMIWRCSRTIGNVLVVKYNEKVWTWMKFKLNLDATLVGVQLPTQVLEDSKGQQYEEKVKIYVLDGGKLVSPWIIRHRRVPYNSTWDISLQEPLNIKENLEYGIRVEPLVPGHYPRARSAAGQTDSAGPHTVTWLDAENVPRLVRALLFEK